MSAPHDAPSHAPAKPVAPDCHDVAPHPVLDVSDIGVSLKLAGDLSAGHDSNVAFAGLADLPVLQLASGGAIEVDPGMESAKQSDDSASLISLGAHLAAETSGDTGAGTDGAFLASLLGGGTAFAASVLGGEPDSAQADYGCGDRLAQPLLGVDLLGDADMLIG